MYKMQFIDSCILQSLGKAKTQNSINSWGRGWLKLDPLEKEKVWRHYSVDD
jgi:hypothetical protein